MFNTSSYNGQIQDIKQTGNPTHDLIHIPQIQMICKNMIYQIVPKLCGEIFNKSLEKFVQAFEYDIKTCVDLSIKDCGEIFHSEKFRQVLSDNIVKEMKAKISDIKITF